MDMFNFYRVITRKTNLINYATKQYFSKSSCLFKCGKNIREILLVPVKQEQDKRSRKISIIGAAGIVGSSIAYNLFRYPICDELVLIDAPAKQKKLCGETLDLLHYSFFFNSPKLKQGVDMKFTARSDLIILSCGQPRKPEQSRNDVVQTNVNIFKEVVPLLAKLSPDAVFLVVANPVDIMAYAAWKYSGFDKNRIIGAGTEVDTARFRYLISKRLPIHPYSIDAHTILEHGECNIPLWSMANVAGTRLRDVDGNVGCCSDPNKWNDLHHEVQAAGGTLNKLKGWTNWTISVAIANIAQSVLQDSGLIHQVAICPKGFMDIDSDCFMTFPAVLGNRGVREVVQQVFDEEELISIRNNACAVNKVFKTVKF